MAETGLSQQTVASSVSTVIIMNLKLMMISWVYLLVVGGGNVIGAGIMILITGAPLGKVVNRVFLSIVTIPLSTLLLILFPLMFIESVKIATEKMIQKLLDIFFE